MEVLAGLAVVAGIVCALYWVCRFVYPECFYDEPEDDFFR